jgi:two-component system, OmpR family, sensor histidine kinase CreC
MKMKLSFSLRAFVAYFIILGGLTWFFLDQATEKLKTAFQQSSETVLVDTSALLATSVEILFRDNVIDTDQISHLFEQGYQRQTQAQIYSLFKNAIDLEIYITDRQGFVIYDSTGLNIGEDYSKWRDVKLTLAGEYGARTSYRYPDKTTEDDEKIMVVAAPIKIDGDIVGVLSVVKPIQPLEQLLAAERENLILYALFALAIAMAIGYLLSHGFTLSISKLVNYANTMAKGQRDQQPEFMDKRFDNLATAITHMRDELDGKEYVEHYIHSLTHELKTPLTAVAVAAELLSEEMPVPDQKKFIGNIRASNHRMQLLVERILDLTKLENLNALSDVSQFDLCQIIKQQLQQSQVLIDATDCIVNFSQADQTIMVNGDELLIRQCISNLLDNAIENSPKGSHISITYQQQDQYHQLNIMNTGHLDDFVIERAFERFFSVQSEVGVRKRTGLGLSFAREIMHLHQGEVTLLNADGGICAEMRWPISL